jgi:hypothetical protein
VEWADGGKMRGNETTFHEKWFREKVVWRERVSILLIIKLENFCFNNSEWCDITFFCFRGKKFAGFFRFSGLLYYRRTEYLHSTLSDINLVYFRSYEYAK